MTLNQLKKLAKNITANAEDPKQKTNGMDDCIEAAFEIGRLAGRREGFKAAMEELKKAFV